MKTYEAEHWGLKIDPDTHELTKQKRMKTYEAEYWGLKLDPDTHELTKQKRRKTVRAEGLKEACWCLMDGFGDLSRVTSIKEVKE